MDSKGKSEHERIADLEALMVDLQREVSALARLVEAGGRSFPAFVSPMQVFTPLLPAAALTRLNPRSLLVGGFFALTDLPRTITSSHGNSPCEGPNARKNVYTFTAAEKVVCVVEATDECSCKTVQILLLRGAGIVARSPEAEPGNTASFGPVDARVGDILAVACSGQGLNADKCQYNWQVNRAS